MQNTFREQRTSKQTGTHNTSRTPAIGCCNQKIEERLGPFSIDLFASRTNHQLPVYCSWKPDPMAFTVDALSITWKDRRSSIHVPSILPNSTVPQEDRGGGSPGSSNGASMAQSSDAYDCLIQATRLMDVLRSPLDESIHLDLLGCPEYEEVELGV